MEPNTQPTQTPTTPLNQTESQNNQTNSTQGLDSFHSNGFASVANDSKTVVSVPDSFSQRRKLDSDRRVVDGYRFSNMGRTFAGLRAKPFGDNKPK